VPPVSSQESAPPGFTISNGCRSFFSEFIPAGSIFFSEDCTWQCTYIYIYMYIQRSAHVHTYIYMYTYTFICIIHVYIHIHIARQTSIYTYTYTRQCTYTYINIVYIYIYMYIYIYILHSRRPCRNHPRCKALTHDSCTTHCNILQQAATHCNSLRFPQAARQTLREKLPDVYGP